jgi:hypothetical protein
MEIGRQVSERLIQAAGHMVDAASRMPQILHLQYREVVANPMAAVRALYHHCGLELSEIAEQRMVAFLERPRPLSAQRYDFAEFGFDPGALRERFADYVRCFGVP